MTELSQQHLSGLDKDRVYWVWIEGRQVQIAWDSYSGRWYARFNDSGIAGCA